MKQLRQLISAVTLLIFASAAAAQTEQTTNNLITNNPAAWSGIGGHSQLGGAHPITLWGCCTSYSGSMPFFDSSTGSPNGQSGQIIWSFGQATVRQVIGINTALSGTGIQINGYNWGYEVRNMNGNNAQSSYSDVLTATTFLTNVAGTRILSDTRTYSGAQEWNWHGGTVSAASPVELANAGQLGVEFSSRDAGFWAGYYGPQVRNVSLSLNYTVQADPCVSNPQSSPACPGYRTYYTFGDDSYVHVPLPFGFPFYGQTFTNSWMHSNGVVSFLNPAAPINGGSNAGAWAYCCGGPNLGHSTTNFGAQFNYIIAPLWTDLYPVAVSQFYTTQDSTYIRYHWDNVAEISNWNNLSTFSLELRPSGYYGIQYGPVNVQNQQVTVGSIGNLQLDEKTHHYFGTPGAFTGGSWSVNSTQAADCSNPLNNINCPGYQQAYFEQQCSINTLYDPACPGYAQAYYNYQCSINTLYHSGCPGYAQAYFDQQCGLNPLYDAACPGYADAFYVQQCTADPLYDSGCTGYAEAYALKFIVNSPNTAAPVEDPVAATAAAVEEKIATAAVTETAASAATARPAEPAAPVQLVAAAPAPAPAAVQPAAAAPAATRTEPAAAAPARTTRQALAEQRMAAAREAAAKSAQENPGAVTAEMDAAASLEQQAELQNVVLGAMAFVAGFDAYGRVTLPDAVGYRPFEIYPGQQNIDTPSARGLIGRSDRIHEEMVNEQWNR